jgi:hypothetical protein
MISQLVRRVDKVGVYSFREISDWMNRHRPVTRHVRRTPVQIAADESAKIGRRDIRAKAA